ncbi:hypothetical protein [Mailhella massiliensis]|uniref:hypothetical protein n=1 Tax=Mailhella massiliensis TaxID=1903261 RepID=UPI002352A074|nr:hypothetical protein [Mailhella massiliensis]
MGTARTGIDVTRSVMRAVQPVNRMPETRPDAGDALPAAKPGFWSMAMAASVLFLLQGAAKRRACIAAGA